MKRLFIILIVMFVITGLFAANDTAKIPKHLIGTNPDQVRPAPNRTYEWYSYAMVGEETNLNWPTPERATFFELVDFCLEGPATIEQVSHLFYEHSSYPWPDATFRFKIYDTDGATLLHESADLEAENYVEYFYTLPTPLVVSGDFWVAVVPTDASGHPSSMSTSGHDGHTYNGEAGAFVFYEGFEYITGAYLEGGVSGPVLSATPLAHDFGNVELGSSASQTFVLERLCSGEIVLDPAPMLTGDAAFSVIADNGAPYPTTIPTDQTTVEVEVQFAPTATGAVSTVLSIYDDLTRNTTDITINGNGTLTPDCDWYIIGNDSYGDGWNGGSIDVVIGGATLYNWAGPATTGPETFTFGIWEAELIDLVWNPGSWDSEITYTLYNNFDEVIFTEGPNPVGTTGIMGTCVLPPCPAPSSLYTSDITADQADLGWTVGDAEAYWDIELGLAGFTPTEVPTADNVTANPYTYTGLLPETDYEWYVRADCGGPFNPSGDKSFWIGPNAFTTLATCPIPDTFVLTTVSDVTATVDWATVLTATGYNWEVVPTGNDQGVDVVVSGTTTHSIADVTGLAALTGYDFRAQSICPDRALSAWSAPFTFTTVEPPVTLPYTQNFDGVTPPALPDGWSSLGDVPQTSTTQANSVPNSAEFWFTTGDSYLIGPYIDTAVNVSWVKFWAFGGTGYNLDVGIMTNPDDAGTFVPVQTVDVPAGWNEYIVSFNAMRTNTWLAFYHNDPWQYIYIDDVTWEEYPTCPQPTVLSAANISFDQADLAWVESGSAALWDIELGTSGFTPTGVPTQAGVTNPYTYTGLAGTTAYDYYVRADCGAEQSLWAGPYSFLTTQQPGTCGTWTIDLYDSYGDGWNGGSADLYVDGTLVHTGMTVPSGNGPVTYTFETDIESIVSVDYTAGAYSSENRYTIYDHNAVAVVTEGNPSGTPNDLGGPFPNPTTGYMACPIPSDEKEILTYSFPEQTGPAAIDAGAYTVDVEVAMGTDVTVLVAAFTLSADATGWVDDGLRVLQQQTSGVTANDFTLPVTYTIIAEDLTEQEWVVTVTEALILSPDKEILAYSFAEQTGPAVIDNMALTVDVEVAYLTDPTALVATFTLSDLASAWIDDGLRVLQEQTSGVTANDFTNPVNYTTRAEDSSEEVWVVTVTVAPPAHGDAIADPFVPGALPWNNLTGSTVGFTDNYGPYGDAAGLVNLLNPGEVSYFTTSTLGSGPDVVFELVLATDTELVIDLCASGFDTAVALVTGDGLDPEDVILIDDDSYLSGAEGCSVCCQSYIHCTTPVPAGTYYLIVGGYGTASGDYDLTVTEILALVAPVNVMVSVDIAGLTTLTWDAVAGAGSYKVYGSDDPYGTFLDVSADGAFTGESWTSTAALGAMKFFEITADSAVARGVPVASPEADWKLEIEKKNTLRK